MPTTRPTYAAASALTITLASLASSSTLLAGRESTIVDNTSNLYDDAILEGKIKTTATTTANTVIEIWIHGEAVSGSTYMGGATGSDANLSPADAGIKRLMKLATVIDNISTGAVTFNFGGISVAQLFGGVMPRKWGVFVVHNTGQNLDSTGSNHVVEYVGVHYTAS